MQGLKTTLLGLFVSLLLLPAVYERVGHSQTAGKQPTGQANVAAAGDDALLCPIDTESTICNFCPRPQEALAGFDNLTNGMVSQAQHDKNRATFEVRDQILPDDVQEGGLGPVYNAQSCAECHQNPVTGAISQITELRAGFNIFPCSPNVDCEPTFQDAPGGSLINDRAVDMRVDPSVVEPNIQERVPPKFSTGNNAEANVMTPRTSLNTLGDGFVEAISNQTLLDIAANQPNDDTSGRIVHGQAIRVPIEESPVRGCRIGRFGHKDQHASLLSFSADAYLNEMGITNRFFLMENTSLGRSTANFDFVPDDQECEDGSGRICGEDVENDIDAFTEFMRATRVPPRDAAVAAQQDAIDGEQLFNKVGCGVCHQPKIITAPVGTVINLGAFTVPQALGNKIIRPYGDFLLHDIGTGDGIVQNGGPTTRLKVRTAPLWGVRTRTRLMHDGLSLTFKDAISRHGVEAEVVRANFDGRTAKEKQKIITFLESL
ncbi:MAG TPA: di-heme oxidoredictase family protein [Pyrinomonadaceae bacterium]|jgi:CxxC motif-containing protein (DUF1111 family)